MAKAGRPFDVKISLTPRDAVNILNTVVYGGTLILNGDRAKTASGRAVRLMFGNSDEDE